tara:strand:+ start:907 stop:3300 length:2394 start_codon:yes stop_codon:yes gene_type:complete
MFTFPVAHFAGGVDFTVEQSLRFNSADSAYLENANYSGSPTSGTDCTFSFWVKRCKLGATQVCIYGGDASGSTYEMIRFDSDDQFRVAQASSVYDLTTTQVFRDVAAWSHFVVAFDTDGAAADRIKIYHNGSRITDFSVQTNPSSGYVTNFNTGGSGEAIQIGREGGNSQFLDAYLSEINFVDGQALTPSAFAETTSNGVYQPIEYAGAYGTNGFRITGEDSSDLGEDFSTNNNDFSSNNLTAADSVSDSPSSNHCTLNPLWVDGHTLSDGNLVASAAADSAAIGTMAFDPTDSAGFYFEAKVTTAATYPNVGIRTVESPSQVGAVTSLSGNSTGRYAFTGSNGQFNDAGSGSSYGSAWAGTADKVIGVLVKAGALYFSIDGTIQNSGTAAKTGLTGLMLPTVFYDAGSGTAAAWEMRFDASDWSTTPSGYKAISSTSLADPSIPDASVYFQSTLYSGNGSTQSITNGGNSDLQPDLVWIKNRSAADSNVLTDAVRGVTKILSTDSTGAESTDADTVTAFASDGFALGDDDKVNTSSENYVSWQWKADSAWSESATGNILASSGRRNTTAGFSICSWTHRTSANYAIKHGLSTTPEFFMTKSRDSTTNWDTWHKDLADTAKRILINGTGAEITAYWVDVSDSADGSGSYGDISSGESPVTSSLFGFQHDNFSGTDAIIGYFFHSVEGYSSFGSYVGNGSATAAPFIFTGFRPALVVTKNISNSGDAWPVADSARSPFNVSNDTVFWNQTTAGATGYQLDLLSNGFRPYSADHSVNESGATIIYAAFAESPFKTALAR